MNIKKTINNELRSRLMLATLHIKEWGNYRVDRSATDSVQVAHGAKSDSGKFNKALLPPEAIKPWITAKGKVRSVFYEYTRPWADDGVRVLTAEAYYDMMTDLAAAQAKAMHVVKELARELPEWQEKAKAMLGDLYDEHQYPTPEELEAAYGFSLHEMPLPHSSDFRVDLDDTTLAEIQGNIDARVQEATQDAQRGLYGEAHQVLTHLAMKLEDNESIFRDSTVHNVKRLQEMLPQLNLLGEDRVTMLADDIGGLLKHAPQELRTNIVAREATAAKARKLSDRVAGWL